MNGIISDLQFVGWLALSATDIGRPLHGPLDSIWAYRIDLRADISFSEIQFASPLGLEYVFRDLPKEIAAKAVKHSGEIFRRLIMPAQMEERADIQNNLLREEVSRKRLENAALALEVYKKLPPEMRKPWLDEALQVQTRFKRHPQIIEATFDNGIPAVERSAHSQPDSEEGPFETEF